MKLVNAIVCACLLLSAAGCAKAPTGAAPSSSCLTEQGAPAGTSTGTSAAQTTRSTEGTVGTVSYNSAYLAQLNRDNGKILDKAGRSGKRTLLSETTPEGPLCQTYLMERFNLYVSHQLPSLIQFDEAFPVQCIRRTSDERAYTIHRTDGGAWFYAFFFTSGPEWLLSHTLLAEKSLDSRDFRKVTAGTTLEAVCRIDPVAQRYETTAAAYEMDRFCSLHLLRDGVLRLQYEKQEEGAFVVTEKEHFADFKIPTGYEQVLLDYDCSVLEQDYPA